MVFKTNYGQSLNAGQTFYRMLLVEHSAILLTFIKLPFVIKIFVLPIFECLFTQVLLYYCFIIFKGLAVQFCIFPAYVTHG